MALPLKKASTSTAAEIGTTSGSKKLLMVFVSTLISLLIAEGAVRFAKRGVAFQPDPELIRSLSPNTHTKVINYESDENLNGLSSELPSRPVYHGNNNTNNIAFRMGEDVGEKAPDEERVLLLGDSYTEADQVTNEQRFSYLVDQRLRAETANGPRHVRVLNGGIQGGAPSQYILQLRKWLPTLKPDVVIVNLAPNDINDDLLFERLNGFTFDADGAPLAPKAQLPLWLMQKSYLLRYFHVLLQHMGSARAMDFFFPPAMPDTPIVEWTSILCSDDATAREMFPKKTGKYLNQIKAMVEASGARFGVFLIHYMWTFDDEPYYEPRFPTFKTEMRECYASHGRPYNEFIESYLHEHGMTFHNPLEALLRAKAENPKRKLWNFFDYHYSPAGHQVNADEMLVLIKKLL
jgi:lysophospholipase L1-like esterase